MVNINRLSLLLLSLSLWLMIGCRPSVPSEYIQQGKMEDILYDYHLALGMADDQCVSEVQKESYKLAVLKKHDVSQKEFNKSMEYYMRHTERMHDIYENLSKRLEEEAREQGATLSELNQFGVITSKGDTADIWKSQRAIAMSTYQPYNQLSFSINADTAFHKGDRFVLRFNTQFIVQEGMRNGKVGLIITFKNDSVAQQVQQVTSDGQQSLTISDNDSLGIKNIRGFFILNPNVDGPTTTLTMMFVTQIQLVRMHVRPNTTNQGPSGPSNPMNGNTPLRIIGGPPPSPTTNRPR